MWILKVNRYGYQFKFDIQRTNSVQYVSYAPPLVSARSYSYNYIADTADCNLSNMSSRFVFHWNFWSETTRIIQSFKYNQLDATLYNILYYWWCSTCFRRFFHPSSGAQAVNTTSGICQAYLLLPLAWVSWHCQLTHASGSSKEAWHIPDAVCTVWAPDDGRKTRL